MTFLNDFRSSEVFKTSAISGMATKPIRANIITPYGKKIFFKSKRIKFPRLALGSKKQRTMKMIMKKAELVKTSSGAIVFMPLKIK